MTAPLHRLSTAQEPKGAVSGAELVIEAVIEDMAVKLDLFERLDRMTPPHTLLATNTPTLSVTEMAGATRRREHVVGKHFFNPAHIMKLVEIIRGLETTNETVRTAEDVSRAMGKESVLVNESPGFVTSRVNALVGNEAFRVLQGRSRLAGGHRQGHPAWPQLPDGAVRDGGPGRPGHPPAHPEAPASHVGRPLLSHPHLGEIRQGGTAWPQDRERDLRVRRARKAQVTNLRIGASMPPKPAEPEKKKRVRIPPHPLLFP